MKKVFSVLMAFVFLLGFTVAQDIENPCGTVQGRSKWLKKYQAQPHVYEKGGDTTLYIAMSIHIVGKDDGTGYYSVSNLMNAFCKLNELYDGTGIQFYLAGDIDYINNTAYYNHGTLLEGAEMMFEHNIENTLNTYFVSSPAGNCGYNLPYAGIANAKSCSGADDVTWAHEVGHALSLPHPFYGWEDDGYVDEDETHNYADPAPDTVFMDDYTFFKDTLILDTIIYDTVLVERTDGSNCHIAADGFCDTAPDYLSNRWTCNGSGVSSTVQRDPEGVAFQSDGSLVMNYADDACQVRFSPEQQNAMRAFALDEREGWVSYENLLPPIESSVTIIAPLDGEDVTGFTAELSWEPIDNATHYLVLVSRLASFTSGLTTQDLTTETSISTAELLDGKTYHWKVLGFNRNQFCGEYNASQSFTIFHPDTSVEDINGLNEISLYPQPIAQGQSLSLYINMANTWNGELEIKNQLGQSLITQNLQLTVGPNRHTLDLSKMSSGVYWLAISNGSERLVRKVVIQ